MLATSVSNNLAESRTNKFPFMATSVGGLFQFVRLTQSGRDKQNIKPSRMTQSGHSTSDRKQRSILARSSRLGWLRVGSKK